PNGYVYTFKQDGGYGFLRDSQNQERYFQERDVDDQELREQIRALKKGQEIPVICEHFAVGGKFRSRNLQPCRTVAEIIASAKKWADHGKLSQAIGELQRVLDAIGEHPEVSALLAEWREQSRSRGMILSNLPRGNSLYAQAKRAHLVDNDLTRA